MMYHDFRGYVPRRLNSRFQKSTPLSFPLAVSLAPGFFSISELLELLYMCHAYKPAAMIPIMELSHPGTLQQINNVFFV